MEDNVKYIAARRISRTSITDIDEIREENAAYRYLCHLEEARLWIQECIQVKLPHSTEFEAVLRNGVYLAKLGNFIAPHVVPLKKIFDVDQKIYNTNGLHYRHTDNINYWILAMKAIDLPSYFYPNAFDVYGKKNMPKVIYCLHALNLYLHRCFKGMKIIDLIGKIKFSAEEINSVSREFKKFGIQLPSFSKINGILAKEIAPKDTAVHAAIIAVNIAASDENREHLLEALMNPNALLQNVLKENAESYWMALSELKSSRISEMKSEHFSNKHELRWDFLTQKVIQEEIDSVNLMTIIGCIKKAVLNRDINDFMHYLQSPILTITDIVEENAPAYFSKFKEIFYNGQKDFLNLLDIQSLISLINHDQESNYKINSALNHFNKAVLSEDIFSSFNILKSLVTDIDLYDFGSQFYHSNFKKLRHLKGECLDFEDVQTNLPVFNALLDISIAVIQHNENDTYKALSNPVIKSWELNPSLKTHYFNALSEIKHRCLDILSVDIVKNCVTDVNTKFQFEDNLNYVENINFSLSIRDEQLLINSLLEDPLILCVYPKHKTLYVKLLLDYQQEKNNNFLLRSEIQNQINKANKLVLDAEYYCACLVNINIAIDKDDEAVLFDSLKVVCKQESICSGCKDKYLNQLTSKRVAKHNECPFRLDVYKSSWVKWDVLPEVIFYLNLKTLETAWNLDNLSTSILDKNDILEAVTAVKKECLCHKHENLETLVISFQSFIRGYLTRQKISSEGKIVTASYTSLHDKAVIKLQSFVRMSLVRKKYLSHRADQLRLNAAARIIQRQWRAFKVIQNLNILAYSSKPPLSLLRNIIYMLETSNEDYSEEFKLHMIKGKVVQTIRYNQTLLKEIGEMDVKIGLLIRNRINLEELLKQKKKIGLRARNEMSLTKIKNQSSKFFSKKYNSLIESYENLLYLLQTQPVYLSRLIVSLPTNQATSLIESIIFSLYNFGSTQREEYLLLKMLSLTLEEDIRQKGDNLNDIIKGENIIMKIIISFYRKTYWRDCLKSLLQPLVLEVLNDKSTLYSMDPVEIYKIWLNELEMETGRKSSLPYEITAEEALCHSEVNYRFNLFIDSLLNHSLKFCEAIINGHKMIPYGIMFISKILKNSLKQKYSSSSEEELNKIVGNFLYYRYINPAIIAPDIFDIVTTECTENIADYERIKLSTVSKFLYLCVTGQKYAEDTSHLMCLNPYISDCHEKFMQFFCDACKVKEPEEHFNIDVFSEAIVQIPEIYMSLSELQTLYKLVSEREYGLAPDSDDILHEILEDFDTSLFESIDPLDDFLSTEVCLSLKSKYDLEVEEAADEEKMFAETKFMLITLLQVFSDVNDITELYEKEYTPEEEMQFEKLYMMKKRVADNWIRKSQNWETLQALQSALKFNLNSLELAGYITSTNNYQDILNDIAKDIVNRWRYRISRKKEILRLQDVQKQLNNKTIFYLEKLDYYNNYTAACLENMKVGKQNKRLFHENIVLNEVKHKKTVKCSGSKLHEKGILIEIKDIDTCQLKNVHFEISPSEDLGIFTVKAKFMNIPFETVDIDIQELLCLQYQGIAEMNVLDSVKININLLLYLLNSKFYGKSR